MAVFENTSFCIPEYRCESSDSTGESYDLDAEIDTDSDENGFSSKTNNSHRDKLTSAVQEEHSVPSGFTKLYISPSGAPYPYYDTRTSAPPWQNEHGRDNSITFDQLPSLEGESGYAYEKPKPYTRLEPVGQRVSPLDPSPAPHQRSAATNTYQPLAGSQLESLIKDMVSREFRQSRPDVKMFDVAIVYHRNDYDDVLNFRSSLSAMARDSLGEDLKIELYDSEEHFSESKVLVVSEVAKKCSLMFCYLTANFNSRELNFFIEEAIALSKFHASSGNKFSIKAVHTLPSKVRNYSTPSGLVSTNPIDWFDRHSSFTKDKVLALLKDAIKKRKANQAHTSTVSNFKHAFEFGKKEGAVPRPENTSHTQRQAPQRSTLPEQQAPVLPKHLPTSGVTVMYPPSFPPDAMPSGQQIGSQVREMNASQHGGWTGNAVDPRQLEAGFDLRGMSAQSQAPRQPGVQQMHSFTEHRQTINPAYEGHLSKDCLESSVFSNAGQFTDDRQYLTASSVSQVPVSTGQFPVFSDLTTDDVEIDTNNMETQAAERGTQRGNSLNCKFSNTSVGQIGVV